MRPSQKILKRLHEAKQKQVKPTSHEEMVTQRVPQNVPPEADLSEARQGKVSGVILSKHSGRVLDRVDYWIKTRSRKPYDVQLPRKAWDMVNKGENWTFWGTILSTGRDKENIMIRVETMMKDGDRDNTIYVSKLRESSNLPASEKLHQLRESGEDMDLLQAVDEANEVLESFLQGRLNENPAVNVLQSVDSALMKALGPVIKAIQTKVDRALRDLEKKILGPKSSIAGPVPKKRTKPITGPQLDQKLDKLLKNIERVEKVSGKKVRGSDKLKASLKRAMAHKG